MSQEWGHGYSMEQQNIYCHHLWIGTSPAWLPPDPQTLSQSKMSTHRNFLRSHPALWPGAMNLVHLLTHPSLAPVWRAQPWTCLMKALDWRTTKPLIHLQPRRRWGRKHDLHAWGRVRIQDSPQGLFHQLHKWNHEVGEGPGWKAAGKSIGYKQVLCL